MAGKSSLEGFDYQEEFLSGFVGLEGKEQERVFSGFVAGEAESEEERWGEMRFVV